MRTDGNHDSQESEIDGVGEALAGERTIPSVSARKRPPFAAIGAATVFIVVAVTMFVYANKGDPKQKAQDKAVAAAEERDKNKKLSQHLPGIDFKAIAAADAAERPESVVAQSGDTLPATADGKPALPGAASAGNAASKASDRDAERLAREAEKAQREADELARKRLEASPLAYSQKGKASAEDKALAMARSLSGGTGGVSDESDDAGDGLSVKLKPTKVQGARAGLLPHPNFMLTKGHFLECTLEQAINSTLAGLLSCRLANDIYSTNGKVLLIERGSRITGEYQRGLMKGQARLFVLWTRIETPLGVVVDLDSPGTDALGRSGIDGYVDQHFAQRFGAAILLSLIDDVGQYAIAEAQDGNANQINLGGTAQAADDMSTIAMKYYIDIPPTLEKNQGGHVSIYVARDLDFADVYTLAHE